MIALPRIKAGGQVSMRQTSRNRVLTVNVALAFVCLGHEEIRHVSANAVLVAHSVATKHFLQPELSVSQYNI